MDDCYGNEVRCDDEGAIYAFFSPNSWRCVPEADICNGFAECSDASDEKFCNGIDFRNVRKALQLAQTGKTV